MKTRSDTERLDYIMPCLSLSGTETECDSRVVFLSGALMLKKAGRDAIDAAMEAEEEAKR